ncbi:unnamed protein product [Diplocarpon coronariae]
MAAIATGTDNPAATKRKDRRVNITVETDRPDSDRSPLLPTAERSPFTHEFPIEDYAASAQGWALPGIGLPTLRTLGASFAQAYKLLVGIAVLLFGAVDTALDYLRYPLLGLLIFALINGKFGDSRLRQSSIATKTRTVTAISTTTSYLNSATTVLTASWLTPPKEISTPPTVESLGTLPRNPPVTSEDSETEVASSSRAQIEVPAIASKLDELNSSSSLMSSKLSAETISAASSSTTAIRKKVLAAARIIPLSGTVGGARTTSVKKRMY